MKIIYGSITFKDTDGNLIAHRKSDTSYWCKEFIQEYLKYESRRCGVKILSSTDFDTAMKSKRVECVVDYL